MVGFKNDKALKREQIISEREFPVTNIFYDTHHTYAVLDLKDYRDFIRYIKALSNYIIDKYEGKILKKIIKRNYPEIPITTICEIIKLKDDENKDERLRVIEDILKGYFLENKKGSVEGIVNFRLNEYKKRLNATAEDLVDIYYLNKEYEDFINLLKYFISVQNYRPEFVYIVVNGDGIYTILDDKRKDITKETVEEIVSPTEADDIANDDLLISMLISLAPKKIIVENKEKIENKQLFETIEKVFLNVEYN